MFDFQGVEKLKKNLIPAQAGIQHKPHPRRYNDWILAFAGMRVLIALVLLFPLSLHAALEEGLAKPFPAPEVSSLGPWLNTPPLTSKDLKGKVVLVDFWTYSCINCLRTLPYLRAWYEHYKDQGFVIIGVHAPEFDFEKNTANVQKAVTRFHVTWPVVQDNDHLIWDRFQNEYWPAHYLINRDGQVVYTHFGEGNYDRTESNIRELLGAQATRATVNDDMGEAAYHQTQETYLGTARGERFAEAQNGPESYKFAADLAPDYWSLQGKWQRAPQFIEAKEAGAALRLRFRGGKVFLVLGTGDGKPVRAKILFNGAPAGDKAGKDVKDGVVEVVDHRLYELINRKTNSKIDNSEGVLEIQVETPGLQAYAFTFGA